MHARQVVELSSCVSRQSLVVTRPLLLRVSLRTEVHIVHVLRGARHVGSYVNVHILMPDTVLTVVWVQQCWSCLYSMCGCAREWIMSDRYEVREEKGEEEPSLYILNCIPLSASNRAVHGVWVGIFKETLSSSSFQIRPTMCSWINKKQIYQEEVI